MTLTLKDPLRDRILATLNWYHNRHESVYIWKLKKATLVDPAENFMEGYNILLAEQIIEEIPDSHNRLRVRLKK